jgi:hypothetical protein
MTAGKLASVKPAATTNTFLYRAPIDSAASAVLNVVNQSGSGATYRAALRDYDQVLTVNGSSYEFRKGNVVSSYAVSIIPGITRQSLSAGSTIAVTSGNANFKFLDVLIDTSIKNIPTKIANIGFIDLDSSPSGGTIDPGDTVTGAYGLTSTVYTYNILTNGFTADIPNITTGATSIYFSDITGIATADLVAIPGIGVTTNNYELVTLGTITSGTHLAAVTRGQLATTPIEHPAGAASTILRPTATTTTLSAAIDDAIVTTISVTSSTGMSVGDYLRIGNELLQISAINGNNIDVSRGQFSTTASAALNGATVTYITDEGRVIVQYYESGESVSVGAVTATIGTYTTTSNPFGPELQFVFDTDGDGIFEDVTSLTIDQGRTYRFTQSDPSNTNYTLRFVATASTTEYTTGVTINGTAGTAGAYTEIVVSNLTASVLNTYAGTVSEYNVTVNKDSDPTYTKIYIYDLDGTLSAGESFSTTTGTNEVDEIYPGPYGYVHNYTGTSLKVSLGLNSTSFAEYTTTITGSSGSSTITVGSATNLIPGMAVSGTGIATGARISEIVGTTITLDTANSGAVSGTGTFEHIFYDSPRENGSNRNLVKVSSYTAETDINDSDYLFYGKSVSANSTDKNSGIVIGPGQSIVVYSSAADLNYVLNGFEDSTSDFTVNLYNRI